MWFKPLHKHYFTPTCGLCGLKIDPKSPGPWCHHCRQMLLPGPHCRSCGLATPGSQEHCGVCLKQPPPWRHLYHLGAYRPPLSTLIHQLKFHHQFWQADFLAPLLAQQITDPAPQLISVPLHWRRFMKRGYNQSDRLARALVRELPGSHYQPGVFRRTRATPAQHNLNRQARQTNLHNAFRLTTLPEASHVALIDDVVTTGSTLRQLCQLLLEVGVETIDIYCLSRTPEPGD